MLQWAIYGPMHQRWTSVCFNSKYEHVGVIEHTNCTMHSGIMPHFMFALCDMLIDLITMPIYFRQFTCWKVIMLLCISLPYFPYKIMWRKWKKFSNLLDINYSMCLLRRVTLPDGLSDSVILVTWSLDNSLFLLND